MAKYGPNAVNLCEAPLVSVVTNAGVIAEISVIVTGLRGPGPPGLAGDGAAPAGPKLLIQGPILPIESLKK